MPYYVLPQGMWVNATAQLQVSKDFTYSVQNKGSGMVQVSVGNTPPSNPYDVVTLRPNQIESFGLGSETQRLWLRNDILFGGSAIVTTHIKAGGGGGDVPQPDEYHFENYIIVPITTTTIDAEASGYYILGDNMPTEANATLTLNLSALQVGEMITLVNEQSNPNSNWNIGLSSGGFLQTENVIEPLIQFQQSEFIRIVKYDENSAIYITE